MNEDIKGTIEYETVIRRKTISLTPVSYHNIVLTEQDVRNSFHLQVLCKFNQKDLNIPNNFIPQSNWEKREGISGRTLCFSDTGQRQMEFDWNHTRYLSAEKVERAFKSKHYAVEKSHGRNHPCHGPNH